MPFHYHIIIFLKNKSRRKAELPSLRDYFHVRGNNKPYPDINIYRKLIHFSGCMG